MHSNPFDELFWEKCRAKLPPDVLHDVEERSVDVAVRSLMRLQGCQLWKHASDLKGVELSIEQVFL